MVAGGLLSNIHLGARDPAGEFVMVGKTFKGMTDEMLAWQTEAFLEWEAERDGITVIVRPEQVVEVALDGVQTSTRYPGGVALRFARVKGYRPDKDPDEADTNRRRPRPWPRRRRPAGAGPGRGRGRSVGDRPRPEPGVGASRARRALPPAGRPGRADPAPAGRRPGLAPGRPSQPGPRHAPDRCGPCRRAPASSGDGLQSPSATVSGAAALAVGLAGAGFGRRPRSGRDRLTAGPLAAGHPSRPSPRSTALGGVAARTVAAVATVAASIGSRRRSSRCILRTSFSFSGDTSVMTVPGSPARPVRPARWT